MMLRPHTVLLPTGTGWTTLATVPVQGPSREQQERAPGLSEGADPDLADAEWHRTVLAVYEDVLHIKGKSAKTHPD
jgi:hypothetical protein